MGNISVIIQVTIEKFLYLGMLRMLCMLVLSSVAIHIVTETVAIHMVTEIVAKLMSSGAHRAGSHFYTTV